MIYDIFAKFMKISKKTIEAYQPSWGRFKPDKYFK